MPSADDGKPGSDVNAEPPRGPRPHNLCGSVAETKEDVQ